MNFWKLFSKRLRNYILFFVLPFIFQSCKTSTDKNLSVSKESIFEVINQDLRSHQGPSKDGTLEGVVLTESTLNLKELLSKARQLVEKGDYQEAEAYLYEALKRAPSEGQIFLDLANLEYRRGNYTEVIGFLESAKTNFSRLDRPDPDSLIQGKYLNALTFLALGQIEDGRILLSEIISEAPDFVGAYTALAQSHIMFHQWHLVEKIINSGFENLGERAPLLTLKAAVARFQHRDKDSELLLKEAIQIDKTYVPALVKLAQLQLDHDRIDEAEANIALARKLNQSDGESYIIQGLIEKYKGHAELAESAFNAALKFNPKNYLARYHLGLLYLTVIKDNGSAQRYFNEALYLAPKGSDVAIACRDQLEAISL